MDNVEIIQQWLVEKNQEGVVRNVYHDGEFSGPSYEEMATDLASRLNGTTSASLNTTAGAKSATHPVRRRILRVLWTTDKTSPKEIAVALGVALGVVSYHVRMLQGYGAVEVSHTKPRRGALQHFYRLTEDGRQLCLDLFGPEPTS
jgi:DNA-binding MarR family transcriptional regulator